MEQKDIYRKEFGLFSNIRFAFSMIKRYGGKLFYYLPFAVMIIPFQDYGWTFVTKKVIDILTLDENVSSLVTYLIVFSVMMLGVVVFVPLFQNEQGLQCSMTRLNVVQEKNLRVMKMQFQSLEDSEVLNCFQKAGDALNGGQYGFEGFCRTLVDFVAKSGSLVLGFVILGSMNVYITVGLSACALVNCFASNRAGKTCKFKVWDPLVPWWRKRYYMTHVVGDFAYAKDIRMYGLKPWLSRKFAEVNNIRYTAQKTNSLVWFYTSLIASFVWLVSQVGVYGYLIVRVLKHDITIGNFSLYLASYGTFFYTMTDLMYKVTSILSLNREVDDLRSFFALTDKSPATDDASCGRGDALRQTYNASKGGAPDASRGKVDASHGKAAASEGGAADASKRANNGASKRAGDDALDRSCNGALYTNNGAAPIPVPQYESYEFEFKNVSFKYPKQEKYALKNLCITVKKGERLAVVGLNGAGKTTFIKLLLRLYEPTEGSILLNGTDIQTFDIDSYYKIFSPVFQEINLFAFPLSQNVSMKDAKDTDDARVLQCIRDSGLGEKVGELTNGIHTELLKVLYDDGIELSGGQKQKLALARALYKNAPVVVLDEPTAALDALAESTLYKDFDKLIKNKTAVYISHRLSSTQFCNKVAMFKDGAMIEYGTHAELMAQNGEYANMYGIQAQYYREPQ